MTVIGNEPIFIITLHWPRASMILGVEAVQTIAIDVGKRDCQATLSFHQGDNAGPTGQ